MAQANKTRAELAAAITGLSTAINAQLDATKGAEERSKTEADAAAKQAKALYVLQKLTNHIQQGIKKAWNQSLELQQKSLGRGMSLEKVLKATRSQQAQMAGTLTDFATSVDIGYTLIESGLKSSDAGTNELLLYTKLTGGNYKKVAKQLTSLTRGMLITGEQQDSLSTTIQGLSQTFQITTEELVDSLDGFGDQMKAFKTLDIGADLAAGGAIVTAAMGVQAGELGTQFIAQLLSAEGLAAAQLLGVQDERLAILNKQGDMTQNILNLSTKAAIGSRDFLGKILGGNTDNMKLLESMGGQFHGILQSGKQVYEQLKKSAGGGTIGELLQSAKDTYAVNKSYTDSWDNFGRLVWSPFIEVVTKITAVVLDWIANNIHWLKYIGQTLLLISLLIASGLALSKGYAFAKLKGIPGGKKLGTWFLAKLFKGWSWLIKGPLLVIGAKLLLVVVAVTAIVYGITKLFSWLVSTKKIDEATNRKHLGKTGIGLGRSGLVPAIDILGAAPALPPLVHPAGAPHIQEQRIKDKELEKAHRNLHDTKINTKDTVKALDAIEMVLQAMLAQKTRDARSDKSRHKPVFSEPWRSQN